MLAPGERVEIWADFSNRVVGDEAFLDSLLFIGAEGDELGDAPGGMDHNHMGGLMMRSSSLRNGDEFPVARFIVARQENSEETLPDRLAIIERHRVEDAINPARPWRIRITNQMMTWLLNGRTFEMHEVAPDETARVDELQFWEFTNERNPGQMMEQNGMAHSMHVHGTQFQVIERQEIPELEAGVASVRDGYVDEGWKDTVLLMPGERVKVLLRFPHPGVFLYHCHTLEHEDQGMMRNLRVEE
jgi:FtsP/CotA-like multicopper oxidase with cupredoxin domain